MLSGELYPFFAMKRPAFFCLSRPLDDWLLVFEATASCLPFKPARAVCNFGVCERTLAIVAFGGEEFYSLPANVFFRSPWAVLAHRPLTS